MDSKLLKPKTLDLNVDDPAATRKYEHWISTCEKFLKTLKLPASYEERLSDTVTKEALAEELHLDMLAVMVSPDIWTDIRGCKTYTEAKAVLDQLFVKQPSEVFARHRLGTHKQQPDVSLEAYRRRLEQFSRECNFKDATAARIREDAMLLAFLTGVNDNGIRMRLLEEKTLTFDRAYNLALQLHEGHKEANQFYHAQSAPSAPALNCLDGTETGESYSPPHHTAAAPRGFAAADADSVPRQCNRCVYRRCRGGSMCKARSAKCFECGKMGHYAGADLCPKKNRRGGSGGFRKSYTPKTDRRRWQGGRTAAAFEEDYPQTDEESTSISTISHVSSNFDTLATITTVSPSSPGVRNGGKVLVASRPKAAVARPHGNLPRVKVHRAKMPPPSMVRARRRESEVENVSARAISVLARDRQSAQTIKHSAPSSNLHAEIGKLSQFSSRSDNFDLAPSSNNPRDLSRDRAHGTCSSVVPAVRRNCSSVGAPSCLEFSTVTAKVNGKTCQTLIDSGSSKSYIHLSLAKDLNLSMTPSNSKVTLANTDTQSELLGICRIDLQVDSKSYANFEVGVFENLCADVLLGGDFLQKHKSIVFKFSEKGENFVINKLQKCNAVHKARVECPSLFANLKPECKPIATKSRKYNSVDQVFIKETVQKWLKDKVIRPSNSPWRSQIVVVKTKNGAVGDLNHPEEIKRRVCIDFSQTINLFTELDAYPIPRIDTMVNELAKYNLFATFDLKSAYHQVPIRESDKKYTAFEAFGRLFEFEVMPFGVTNGGPIFQRKMDEMVDEDELKHTYPYLDNITIGGFDEAHLKANVDAFMKALKKRNFKLNDSKTISHVSELGILGYKVGKGVIKPDPDRLTALMDLPPPCNPKSMQRALGLFAYYAKWIPNFSDGVKLLKNVKKFPLNEAEIRDFESLKAAIAKATLQAYDDSQPFVVECDASEVAISATLNQGGRPVAFFSRTLQKAELHYPPVEKEAMCIIEAVKHWEHLLIRQTFTLVTDQRSVSFMLDNRKRTKIKNNKILCWRIELAPFSYITSYRPGKLNVGPDTLTRAFCSAISASKTSLLRIHKSLCCPGVARLFHFVKQKNLPFSINDVKEACESCRTCAEIKPKFFKPPMGKLVKATQPMERLNIDFKGPLPSASRNKYILCIIDEFSRFPFCYPCADMSTKTVIRCLENLFYTYGVSGYVHSDRWSSFKSEELKKFFLEKNVATSMSTPYHPQGNSQVERYNGVIWKAVQCGLKSNGMDTKQWEKILPKALHSIRSLLCTATNQTPHERFFNFSRKSTLGMSLPSWLSTPGPILVRNFVRESKNDPLVQKAYLEEANPMYAKIKFPEGREGNISLRDLAPYPADDDVFQAENEAVRPSVRVSENIVSENLPAHRDSQELSNRVRTSLSPTPKDQLPLRNGPVVESAKLNTPQPGQTRTSSRTNRGVPPVRFGSNTCSFIYKGYVR